MDLLEPARYAIAVPDDAFDVVERRRSFALQSIIEVRLDLEERKRLGAQHERTLDDLLCTLRSSLREIASKPLDAGGLTRIIHEYASTDVPRTSWK